MRIRRITSVVGATARVNTGSTICRAALTIISWRHGESESQASISAKPVTFSPHTADRSDRRPEASRGSGKEEGQEQRQPEDRDRETDQRDGADQVSGHLLRITPAIIPTGMPISRAKPKARMHSSMVAGKTSRNCSEISWPLMLDTPKSQCSTLQTRTATHSTGKRPAVGHEG